MGERVVDFGAEHDPRLPVVNHESAPALALTTDQESPLVDGKAHRAALFVEEACIDGDYRRVGAHDLLNGAP